VSKDCKAGGSTGQQRHTDKKCQEMAKNLKTDKDRTFLERSVEDLNCQEDFGKLANCNFWDAKVRVRDGFMVEVKSALFIS
jgi:hypothetical protein